MYVNLLEFHGFLNKCVIKCDLIFIQVKGIDTHNVSKIITQKILIFHVFIEPNPSTFKMAVEKLSEPLE